jgi:hypothetical protein
VTLGFFLSRHRIDGWLEVVRDSVAEELGEEEPAA